MKNKTFTNIFAGIEKPCVFARFRKRTQNTKTYFLQKPYIKFGLNQGFFHRPNDRNRTIFKIH